MGAARINLMDWDGNGCVVLKDPDEKWRIANIAKGRPGSIRLCVESLIDYRPVEKIARNPGPDPTHCFWVIANDPKH